MVPFDIGLDQLDDGSGIENKLLKNKAAWHKSCRDKVNSTKLKRAQKRSNQENTTSHSSVKTRGTSSGDEATIETESKCFFCHEVGGTAGLHQASTLEIDQSVRECAIKLKDNELLAKLSSYQAIKLSKLCIM